MNSKSATRLFYQPFSYFFCWNFGIKLLVLYCRECHNKLALSLPKFFLQLVFKIHFKTFTKILHSQWFIDILGMSICPLRTADQLERMTLGTQDLATRNKLSIIFQYDIICQTKDYKNWYFCFSTAMDESLFCQMAISSHIWHHGWMSGRVDNQGSLRRHI